MAMQDVYSGYPLAMTLIAIAVSTSLILLFRFFRKAKTSTGDDLLPSHADEIVGLYVYPIKSCRGFQVDSAQLLPTGLDLDRNWMFITAQSGEFITIRNNSKMTLIRTSYDAESDELCVSVADEIKFRVLTKPLSRRMSRNHELGLVRNRYTQLI